MPAAHYVPSTSAVLIHELKPIRGILYGFITHSYCGGQPETTVHRLASADDLNMLMVDRFLVVWEKLKTCEGSINFYTTSTVLRSLLHEQSKSFPLLRSRTVVLGAGLQEQWDAAKESCREALQVLLDATVYKDRELKLNRPPHRVIVGTDASRGSDSKTGWSYVTSDGRVHSGVINAEDIGRGEFHAVTCAIERYQHTECGVLDILTDSWEVYKTINNPQAKPHERVKQHAVHCLDAISYARRHDLEVRVHWVRGHSGNILNEHADRAAVNARRCKHWDLGKAHFKRMEHQIRRDLREAIEAISVDNLMPCFLGRDAMKSATA